MGGEFLALEGSLDSVYGEVFLMGNGLSPVGGEAVNSLPEIWNRVLDSIRNNVTNTNFKSIISPLRPISFRDDTLTIGVPNSFTREVIEKRFTDTINESVNRVMGRKTLVLFTVASPSEIITQIGSTADVSVEGTRKVSNSESLIIPPVGRVGPDVPATRKKYTFDNFVVGDSNKFAYNAALMVAENPGHNYNPLFIYGGTGLGKTHLLSAIEDYSKRLNPGIKVRYVQTSVFIDEFIATITLKRDKSTFDQKYINNDIVLFDDIQALGQTDATQNKFFDIFNLLHGSYSHIVLSSDRPPRDIPQLSDRIQSRFEGGLMVDIAPPDIETRLAILRMKAGAEGVEVPDDAMSFIASRVDSNIRALEGLLNRVIASAKLYGSRINLPMVQDVLKNQVTESMGSRTPSIELIQEMTCNFFHISRSGLVSKNRSRDLVHGRQVAMYLCRELTSETLITIGREFGGRDHSTVVHSCRKIENLIKEDRGLLEDVRSLTDMINKTLQGVFK